MKYTPEQFFKLTELIQEAGGVHVDELCAAREYDLTGPKGRRPGKRLYMPGCGNYSIFSIPYEGSTVVDDEGDLKTLPGGEVKLCAVCDDVGVTPRFSACLRAA